MEEAEETLLRLARQGSEEGVEQLLEARKNGAFSLDINCKGRSKHFLNQSPLHLATYFGHYRVVQLLLDHGADIDVVNSCGDTPLHKAALIGNEDIVLLLLERGASVSLINGEGQTPAAVSSDPYITGLLRAACCTERRKRQERMLRAAIEGNVQALDAMLKDRDPPNINCTDVQGNTCLHVAAYRDHKPIAVLLLENGIDTQIRNTQGQLAVDLALSDQMRQLLCVTPVRKLQRSAVRCEGPLIRRFRFTGWKPVWAVLERGVLTYFGSRGDASASVRRKDYKYLDGARVSSVDDPEGATVAVYFSDGTMHRLKCDTDDPVSRKKWVNALQEHIDYSTHYIRQGLGLSDSDDDEIKPLGSMQDAMQSSRAKEQLLREHIQDAMITLSSLQRASSGETSSVVVLEKLQSASACAQDMAASLSHCLALFTQQDELRQLQLRQERERCRVLEQSLHVLAEEHHQLEQSFHRSVSQSLVQHHRQQRHSVCSRAGPLSEDEFFDADGEDTSDDEGTLVSCSTPTELTEYSGISLCDTPPDLSGDDDVQDGDAASVSSLSVVSSQGDRYRRPRGRNQRRKHREERHDSFKSLAETPTVLSAFGRTRLPKEQISGDDFSIWSVLKNAIGKELTKIPMPVVFNEPLSFLQRMAEFMEYSDVLEMAARQPDSISRMEYVAAFAVSGLASNWERVGKPFNPLLGETYELQHNGYRFVCEQVSHHPPVSAFHAQADRFSFHGSIHPKLKFWGRSVEIHPRGVLSVELPEHDEVYTWSNVNCCVHNIIVGKLWIEQYGTMNITNHKTGDRCTILFKPAGWFSKELHRLEGFVFDKSNTRRRFLYGRWTEFIRSTDIQSFEAYEKQNSNKFKLSSGDAISKPGHSPLHSPRKVLNKLNSISAPFRSHAESDTLDVGEACAAAADGPPEGSGDVPHSMSAYSIDIPNSSTLWQADPRPADSHKFYHFTAFAMSLNQRCPGMSLCSSDSRLRPDIRALEEGNIDMAASEKNRLEEKQRDSRKDRQKRRDEWKPRYFKLCSNPHVKSDDWLFLGNYWADKESSTLDIF